MKTEFNIFKAGQTLSLILYLLFALPALSLAAPFALLGDHGIQDEAGRKIIVHTPYKRIISLYGAHTENLFALGLDQEIIGVGTHDNFPSQAQKKKKFSYHDGLEKFLAAQPDLILIRPMIDRGYSELVSKLEEQKITVVSLQPDNVQDMLLYWQILGRLSGRESEARKMIEKFRTGLRLFQDWRSKIRHPKQVFFESIHRQFKTFSPDSMSIFALKTAGGINIAARAKPIRQSNIAAFGKERILASYRQIDVYLAQTGPMNRVSTQDIIKEPGFAIIRAIKQHQVFIVTEELTARPTLRLLMGAWEIGHALYPEIYGQQAREKIYNLIFNQ